MRRESPHLTVPAGLLLAPAQFRSVLELNLRLPQSMVSIFLPHLQDLLLEQELIKLTFVDADVVLGTLDLLYDVMLPFL